MPSSPIATIARQLEIILEPVKSSLTPGTMREVLALVPDPRKRRDIKYGLGSCDACRGEVVRRDC